MAFDHGSHESSETHGLTAAAGSCTKLHSGTDYRLETVKVRHQDVNANEVDRITDLNLDYRAVV